MIRCCQCRCGPVESGRLFTPIDPKGTTGRRWICEECIKNLGVNYDELEPQGNTEKTGGDDSRTQ